MARHHHTLVAFATALMLGMGVFASPGALAAGSQDSPQADNGKSDDNQVPLRELRSFVEILNRVKQGYVEKVSDKKLLENAIQGMVDGLDPHSAYLTPEQYKELTVSTSGKFGGLGIEVQMENGLIRVVAPIDDTPAKRAGIKAGDLILRIDDTAVKGMTLTDAVQKMRGKPGSKIKLTILRKGEPQPLKMQITRDTIHVQSVKSHMLTPGYGYIRISQFSSDTGDRLNKQLKALQKQADGHLKGLVLDLRNNPGGVLNAAVDVADAFLDGGDIVSIRGRTDASDETYSATPGDLLKGQPLVVLVNQGSASASEIVSGALQDQSRGIIMGHKTFGKGSVQTIMPLRDGAALKLTTARYYTPSGRSIQAEGIEPDVPVQAVKLSDAKSGSSLPFSEADLKGALRNDQDNGDDDTAAADAKAAKTAASLAKKDYMLYEGLNLLKGLHIQSERQHKQQAARR